MSWGETLDYQRSSLRWDIKRTMKSLCKRLADIGEECFVVSVNVNNGWVGHMGSVCGDDFINENIHIPYKFLDYCRESIDTVPPVIQKDPPEVQETDIDDDSENERIQIEVLPPLSPTLVMDDERLSDVSETGEVKMETGLGDETKKTDLKEETEIEATQVENSEMNTDSEMAVKTNTVLRSMIHTQRSPKKPRSILAPTRTGFFPHAVPSLRRKQSKRAPTQPAGSIKGSQTPRTRYVPRFTCTLCNKFFKYRQHFDTHLTTEAHIRNEDRDIRCYKCARQFRGVGDLFVHVTQCQSSLERRAAEMAALCEPR